MIKTAPTLGRIAIMAIFAFGSFAGGLYLWIAFGGSSPLGTKGYQVHVAVPEATQLADQSDVRITGVSVGKVVKLEPAATGRSQRRSRSSCAPATRRWPRTRAAMLRMKTLLGETYVELTPGHPAKGDGPRRRHAAARAGRADRRARRDHVDLRPGDAQALRDLDAVPGRGDRGPRGRHQRRASASCRASPTRSTPAAHARRPAGRAVTKSISSTADVFDALSQREGELRGLITDSNRLFAITAGATTISPTSSAAAALRAREHRDAAGADAFGQDGDPVVKQLQPAATELGPTFAALTTSPRVRRLLQPARRGRRRLREGPAGVQRHPRATSRRCSTPSSRSCATSTRWCSTSATTTARSRRSSATSSRPRRRAIPRHAAPTPRSRSTTCARRSCSRPRRWPTRPGRWARRARTPTSSRAHSTSCQSGLPVLTAGPCSNPDAGAADERPADRAAAVHQPARLPHRRQRRAAAGLPRPGHLPRLLDDLPAAARRAAVIAA